MDTCFSGGPNRAEVSKAQQGLDSGDDSPNDARRLLSRGMRSDDGEPYEDAGDREMQEDAERIPLLGL